VPSASTPPPRLRLSPNTLRLAFAGLARLAFNARRPIAVQRAAAHVGLLGLPCAPGASASSDIVGDIAGRRIRLAGGARAGALLYLHGGGYGVGSARGEQSLASYLAAGMGVDAFLPDYRLGPECTHPAALDDALAAYEGLLAEGVPEGRIVVAGESAGGGLALAVAMALRDRGLPAPALVGLLCPWIDLTPAAVASVDSRGAREPLLSSAILEMWASGYAGDAPREDPYLSPLHGDLAGLPPIEIDSGAADPLCAEAEELELRARAAGARVNHRIHPKMMHGFQAAAAISADAHAAVEALASAGRKMLAKPLLEEFETVQPE
jgi:acetyl esterase/lipase